MSNPQVYKIKPTANFSAPAFLELSGQKFRDNNIFFYLLWPSKYCSIGYDLHRASSVLGKSITQD